MTEQTAAAPDGDQRQEKQQFPVARRDGMGTESRQIAETAGTAAAERAKALVQAEYIMAMERPRDWNRVREQILQDCRRPRFAAAARYSLPRKSQGREIRIEGPSIRMAEALARAMGNIAVQTAIVYEDQHKRIVEVLVLELEKNLPFTGSATISKTKERRWVPDNAQPIGTRIGSDGQKLHILPLGESELMQAQEAQVARIRRNLILQLCPADILEEAEETALDTLKNMGKREAVERVTKAFDALDLTPADVAEFLGHSLEEITPAELQDLRQIHAALKDNQTTWDEVLEARANGGEKGDAQADTDRAKLVKAISSARIETPDIVREACAAIDLPENQAPDMLDDETLTALAGEIQRRKQEEES